MHAHQFFARHREHVEGIIVAQIRLHRERKFGEIGELLEVGRMHAGRVEGLLVMRDVVVGMLQRPGEPLLLQRHDLVARGALGVIEFGRCSRSPLVLRFVEAILRFLKCLYFCLVFGLAAAMCRRMTREWPRNSAIT